MKVEARIFDIVTVFAVVVAVIYGVGTHLWMPYGIEPIGTIALILTAGLSLMIGSYFRFVERRITHRPEDRDDAEIHEGAGDLGFFSPGSYWPLGIAAGAALAGIALAIGQWWMVIVATGMILITVGGLVFEYHSRPPQKT
ncbi:cytochrome c oxidase subunit 4 [Haloechinothrix sp. LS1_15]|uniref:cytochrome c oxidase subunit 4 n=1 Tax=Haloechinothrix sp. LS1_15 TaxID=2652248 RepID=UPI0029483443|nr:cytochrome c oxidase subunit 4 [Haloechinothrix sp. LS1_15]MDV6012717.1 cytochrome c oxidase subunit 4 [Haloechinothrix sp. LS1_15]